MTPESAIPKKSQPPASVIDLFCGAGGLSHGFLLEGFRIACGYDIDEACRFAFEENNNTAFVCQDIAATDPRDIAREFPNDIPKVLIGCAPCQPFSRYTQGREDASWRLLENFAQLASCISPDVLSMENVPQLVQFKNGTLFKAFVAKLEGAGYQVRWAIVDSAEFGVPQARARLVLIASRHGIPCLPRPTHTKGRLVTVWDAIRDMPALAAGEVDPHDPLHRASSLSAINLRRIRASTPGGTWRDWEDGLITECHKRKAGRSYTSVYGRMHWHRPSPTITTQFYGFGNGRFGHPEQDRAISLREGAILQTFPTKYAFSPYGAPVAFKKLGRMIGNAVPVTLARAIARAVAAHLEEVRCAS